jgi:hypothetical protein
VARHYDVAAHLDLDFAHPTDPREHVISGPRDRREEEVRERRGVVSGFVRPADARPDRGEVVAPHGLVYAWISRSLRAADYQRVTGRTAPTTSRDLGAAVRLGYLIAEGVSRDRWYRLGPRLLETPAVGEPADPRESTPRA